MALNMHRWQFVLAWQFAALTLSVVTSHFIIYLKKFSRWIFRKRLSSRVIFTLVFAHIERVYLKIATKKKWVGKTRQTVAKSSDISYYFWCLFACVFLSIPYRFILMICREMQKWMNIDFEYTATSKRWEFFNGPWLLFHYLLQIRFVNSHNLLTLPSNEGVWILYLIIFNMTNWRVKYSISILLCN